jgi:hypothetical protein
MKSYGRAPTFLLATGYEQVRSIVAALVGDHPAARRVELELPETGVCSTTPRIKGKEKASAGGGCCGPSPAPAGAPVVVAMPVAAGCCGGPAPQEVEACCVADADAKTAGDEGCGCSPSDAAAVI